jgi:hypothetical protein
MAGNVIPVPIRAGFNYSANIWLFKGASPRSGVATRYRYTKHPPSKVERKGSSIAKKDTPIPPIDREDRDQSAVKPVSFFLRSDRKRKTLKTDENEQVCGFHICIMLNR